MEINQFKSTVLTHQGGFLLSSGDENGDCSLSVDFCSVFYDSAAILGKSWLSFHNRRDEKEVDGKSLGDIYAIGSASINLDHLKNVEEYDGDYLIDRFNVRVSRMFTIELEDECGFGSWLCVGLM